MAFKDYQFILDPNKLYELKTIAKSINEIINYSMEVLGGYVDIYGSYDEEPPVAPPIGMSLDRLNFTGIDNLGNIPRYIYLDGSATKIIINGVEPIEVI